MTVVPLTQCCRLLGIDARTLRRWRTESGLSLHPHPRDARVKGLMMEQVQQLATLHGRCIQLDALAAPPAGLNTQTHLQAESPATSTQIPSALTPDPDVIGKFCSLQATLTTLQQQLTQLALELFTARDLPLEERMQALEALIQQTGQQVCPQPIQATLADVSKLNGAASQESYLHPAELPARSRLLALIEYEADGIYAIISPQQGELHFAPNSAQWFDWLSSLSSFRFVGKLGSFSAYRKSSLSRGWLARRSFHSHHYKRYLGTTEHLTINRLEQVAVELHSQITAEQ